MINPNSEQSKDLMNNKRLFSIWELRAVGKALQINCFRISNLVDIKWDLNAEAA